MSLKPPLKRSGKEDYGRLANPTRKSPEIGCGRPPFRGRSLYVPFSNPDRECESLPRSAGGRPSVFLRHTSITWTAQPDTAERPPGEELTCPGESFQAVKDQAFRAICNQGLRHQKRAKHRYRMDPARPCQDREWSDHTEERRGREVQNVGRPPPRPYRHQKLPTHLLSSIS
jgi:hypothetical protein